MFRTGKLVRLVSESGQIVKSKDVPVPKMEVAARIAWRIGIRKTAIGNWKTETRKLRQFSLPYRSEFRMSTSMLDKKNGTDKLQVCQDSQLEPNKQLDYENTIRKIFSYPTNSVERDRIPCVRFRESRCDRRNIPHAGRSCVNPNNVAKYEDELSQE